MIDQKHELPLGGKNIVFTGEFLQFSRASQREIAAHFGAEVSNIIGRHTAFLVRGVDKISNQKLTKARQDSVETIDEDELLRRLAFKPFDHLLPKNWNKDSVFGASQIASGAQKESVQRFYHKNLDLPISYDRASTMLSIRSYVQALAEILRSEGHKVSDDLEVVVARWVIGEQDLFAYVTAWNDRRFKRGTHNSPPRLTRDAHFLRVYNKMHEAKLLP